MLFTVTAQHSLNEKLLSTANIGLIYDNEHIRTINFAIFSEKKIFINERRE